MNPVLGVFFHWLGGLASASFYIPYRGVKRWSWETYWLVGGFFSWIIAPLALASLLVPDLWPTIGAAPRNSLLLAYMFGMMWGVGGLTFGLTMRYLGIALGMAVALGFCAAFGTLVPPLFSSDPNGTLWAMFGNLPGRTVLLGVLVCLLGIGVSGMAGMSKEKELSPEEKAATVKEFNFGKGMIIAVFSGILSSCMNFGFDAAQPLADLAKNALVSHGQSDLWQNLPVLIIVLWGGFTTNFIWCVILNLKNRSAHEYLNLRRTAVGEVSAAEGIMLSAAAEEKSVRQPVSAEDVIRPMAPAPLLRNYFFSAIAGVTWYMQFFFFGMGKTRMGKALDFSSWTLHMASIIIFSTLWGIALHEWKGTSRRTHWLIVLGLVMLVGSTVIIGYGGYLKTHTGH
jgi:L-rhamnose-H+ transport protein